jgi:Fe-S-cluster-containing dehydrogenase component
MKHRYIACDPDKCSGCNQCELICSVTKTGSFDPARSRIRTVRIEPVVMMSIACRLCEDAPCVIACPRKALTQDAQSGVIHIDNDLCDGCTWCMEACDFGAISLNPGSKKVEICDLCADKDQPQCVLICQKESLTFSTPEQVAQHARKDVVKQLLKELVE